MSQTLLREAESSSKHPTRASCLENALKRISEATAESESRQSKACPEVIPEVIKEKESPLHAKPLHAKQDSCAENAEIEVLLAPVRLRCKSVLLDYLFCLGLSLVLVSPYLFLVTGWVSVQVFAGILCSGLIVLFFYQTITWTLFGGSLGMKVFNLEIFDFECDDFPDFQQASISSAITLFSLLLFGAGFATCFFDQDRRSIDEIITNALIIEAPSIRSS
jgi:uncharacterized RDD family membrane protein YckC